MKRLWVDANVLIRFLTRDPAGMAEKAREVMVRAEQGELELALSPLVLAEAVWTLKSFYGFDRHEIAHALIPLMTADGISTDAPAVLVEALEHFRDRNVDFVDAYLAAHARHRGEPYVCSFDQDFDRLDVIRFEPPGPPRNL